MKVLKRNGDLENISFDKVLNRIANLAEDLSIDTTQIAQKVCSRIYDKVPTSDLDELAAQLCSSMVIDHPDYGILSSRLIISNHQKNTSPSFSETIYLLYKNTDVHGKINSLVSDDVYNIVMAHKDKLNFTIKYDRDYNLDYFGFKTLERSYLLRINGKVIERPQHLFMRVALGIHGKDFKDALETYEYLSQQYFVHATPTLFNAGTNKANLSSCFLLDVHDSVEGMYDLLKECALISKGAGGIGINIHDIRSKNSVVRGSNGRSSGIIPMLRVFNACSRHIDQCLLPSTIVFSQEGLKRMDEITTNDYLITNDGSFKKVNQVVINEKENEEMMEIHVRHGKDPLICTKDHEILVISRKKNESMQNIFKKLNKEIYKINYIPSEQISKYDLMVYPIPQFINNNFDHLSKDYFRLYGIILGDGYINEKKNQFNIHLNNTTKLDTYNFVKNTLCNLGINSWKINDDRSTIGTGIVFTNSNNLFEYNHIYDNNKEKHIFEDYLHLPIDKTCALLKGLMESDGSTSRGGLYFCSTSINLIMSFKYMLLRLGILSTVQTIDKVGQAGGTNSSGVQIIHRKINYTLRIPKIQKIKDFDIFTNFEVQPVHFWQYENYLLSAVKEVKTQIYTGKVYDFNMIDNHNYLTDCGLVHNSGKRNGSIAVYLEPYHADIMEFLDLRKNHGNEEERCRDLFLALWIPDLFMKRVKENGVWSLLCPDECQGLTTIYGDEFEAKYIEYEKEGKFRKQVKAQDVWMKIIESQIETGTPYILYKDAVNKKNNQMNLGTIKSSNLCAEITLYTDYKEEIAVCNLGSICLPKYINAKDGSYNHEELHKIAKILTKNINKVIDINYYPIEKAKTSNLRHRPIGIGIQGLADVFAIMKYPYESKEAKKLNKEIFETIYHGALEASMEIAKKRKEWYETSNFNEEYMDKWCNDEELQKTTTPITNGLNLRMIKEEFDNLPNEYIGAYSSFVGSPISKGIFQFDMWGVKPESGRYDWDILRKEIIKHGIRNSMLVALMPTASTSQICGNNESFEAFNSNIYTRRTLSGEFIMVNKYLRKDLLDLNLWNNELKEKIIINDGSIQNIPEIPDNIKALYKTVWEISQKVCIDLSADRAPYICQTQSLNLFFEQPEYRKLTSAAFHSWSCGLKTGSYYIRSKPKARTQQFTIDPNKTKFIKSNEKDEVVEVVEEVEEGCLSCGA